MHIYTQISKVITSLPIFHLKWSLHWSAFSCAVTTINRMTDEKNRRGYGRKTPCANPGIPSHDSRKRNKGQLVSRPKIPVRTPNATGHNTRPVNDFCLNNLRFWISSICTCHLTDNTNLLDLNTLGVFGSTSRSIFKRFVKINCAKRKLGMMHSLHLNIPIGIIRRNLSKTGPQQGLYRLHDHDKNNLCAHTKGWMCLSRPYQQWQNLC